MTDELRARIRAQYGDGIAPTSYRPDTNPDQVRNSPSEAERARVSRADDARDEKAIVAHADRQMRALGFVVVNYSQPRATKQTAGIPDREYFHTARRLFLKWEAKTPTGKQSPAQREYQEWCEATGISYVVGTDAALFAWLVEKGIAFEAEVGILAPLPFTPRTT